ncbi:hypothetical protein [Hyphococcus luteus]|uniref:Uncharacterized protein n=1 Tax=Hyphococcus luteus TaxID=2058213 RepID=A0A2S7K6M8_9PROT|nr:hypothetical protein [Marinicaulis flavus]PQA88157.1 hypothetical protein CW354_07540 [Marinicaulis flavus]
MKKIALALALTGFAMAPAYAGDLEGHCEAYAEENGTDASGCACLAETADADATEELLAVAAPEDLEGLSDDAKAAIEACFPAA